MENPIHSFMKISMENIKDMVDVDTIVGQPITTKEGTTVIPISRVKFGFASGGTEQKVENKHENQPAPFGGGSGGTVSITPIAFLVVDNKDEIKDLLASQVVSSVLWEDSIKKMIVDGVDTFVEIGPGKVSSGFVKKIDKKLNILNIEDISSLEKALEALGGEIC